jgi:alpha-1,6-mannosyltransferase
VDDISKTTVDPADGTDQGLTRPASSSRFVVHAVSWTKQHIDFLTMWFEMLKVRMTPSVSLAERVEADRGDPNDWRFLRRPALLGLLAILSICVGASLNSSPFKLELSGTWFFGVPPGSAPNQSGFLLFGLVAVYGGMVLLVRVWYGLVKTFRARPDVPVKFLVAMLVLWTVPLLVVAPMFSRDVFSYAAQGEMMSRHINPYNYGPGTLGSGPWVSPVDGLWLNTPAPYGPLFLMVAGFFAKVSGHNELITVVLLRMLSVVGLALIAYCVPKLARIYGRPAGPAFTLAVLNPLTLLALIGSGHNDAIMIGLVVAGFTAAKSKHPVVGIVLCTLAAAIKVPAALSIVYIAWDWMGEGVPLRQRVRPLLTAGIIAVAVMAVLSQVSGLGWGWIANLGTPGTVRSWMAPATAVGLMVSGAAHIAHIGISQLGVLTVTRLLGLVAAAALAVYLLLISDRIGALKALGLSMLLFVVLGPVVQPWYLTWGIILLAPVVNGRLRTWVIGLSMVAPFIGLTGGKSLLNQLLHTDPLSMVAAVAVLLAVFLLPLGRWTSSWRIDTEQLTGAVAPSQTPHAALEH